MPAGAVAVRQVPDRDAKWSVRVGGTVHVCTPGSIKAAELGPAAHRLFGLDGRPAAVPAQTQRLWAQAHEGHVCQAGLQVFRRTVVPTRRHDLLRGRI